MEKCMIVAMSDNRAIGVGGDLPWHIPEDLKYFKRTTMGCPVIMGRKTWLSLPFKPLKGRANIILTRGMDPVEGTVQARTLAEAYEAAEPAEKCFVIGGASVYAAAIGDMDRLFVTHVRTILEEADAFFPEIDPEIWEVETRSEIMKDEGTGYEFEFVVYRRR